MGNERQSTPQGTARLDASIVLLSASLLMFEILQMITLSLQTIERNAFLVVSLCMLGLGAGGSLATWIGELSRERAERLLGRMAAGFALTLVLSQVVTTRTHDLLVLILIGVVPYVFVGTYLAVLFRGWSGRVSRSYFLNLAGSGLGCVGLVALLNTTGDAGLSFLVIAAVAACAALAAPGTRGARLVDPAFALVVAAALVPFRGSLLQFEPDPSKGIARLLDHETVEARVTWSRWGYLGRLDVVQPTANVADFTFDGPLLQEVADRGLDGRYLFASGDNWTKAIDFADDDEYRRHFVATYRHGAPYVVQTEPDVLNIGYGGGIDVFLAVQNGARSVVGVEINPLMIEAVRTHLPGFFEGYYEDPRVEIHNMDGRTYVRGTDRRFDVITLTEVDTGAGLHGNAHVLSENYLFTQEAFTEYFGILTDTGTLYFSRPYTQMLRMVLSATNALRSHGAANPADHVAIFGDKRTRSILISRSPYTPEQIAALRDWYEGVATYLPGQQGNEPELDELFAAVASDAVDEYLARQEADLAPVHDDRPYFYLFDRSLLRSRAGEVLLRILFWTVAVGAVLIVLPLVRLRRVPVARGGLSRVLGYFACLGAGFMLVEVGLIQKLVLYLGHPSYSLTVTLFSILIFSGLGSMTAGRLEARRALPAAAIFVPLLAAVAFYAFGLQPLLEALPFDALPARVAAVVVLLAPGSFFMGMPFPTALGRLSTEEAPLIPWAWAVNSLLSVAGSVITVLLAMKLGFTTTMLVGGGVYLLAMGLFRRRA